MVVLASQSPRRKEILTQAGIAFEVRISGIEEVRAPGESAEAYVARLAREKAMAVEAAEVEYVLAADTTVVIDGRVLEKPHSAADAAAMLRLLTGRRHMVLTGVCLRHRGSLRSSVETTFVHFAPMSEAEIAGYAASGEPMDKAGGYAIQGLASKYIQGIEGCYSNVVGLPIRRVYEMLREAGYPFQR